MKNISGQRLRVVLGLAFVACLAIPLFFSVANAQYPQDSLSLQVYEPATEYHFTPGARAAAMGGAQIAAGDDGSAIWYNPALLSRIRNTELSGTLSHQRFVNETKIGSNPAISAKLNNTGLGSLWAMFPVPTIQGGLTLGLAVNRVRDFDRIFRYSSSLDWFNNPNLAGWGGGEDENGSLWAWSFGGSIEISPRSSVGASLDIFDGHDDYASFFDSSFADGSFHVRHDINDSYTGISGKVGGTYSATNWLNFGAVIGFPTLLSIDQKSDYYDYGIGNATEDHGSVTYRYTLPWSFGFGASANVADLLLTGDLRYNDFTQLKYYRGIADINEADRLVQRYYRDVLSYYLGAEYLIRPASLRLRAGYFSEPIPFKGYPVDQDPRFFTFGAGFLIDKTVNLDLAFQTGSWKRLDPSIQSTETYKPDRFLLTLSYRIK
jgi:long-subunit fatty acid transport protein